MDQIFQRNNAYVNSNQELIYNFCKLNLDLNCKTTNDLLNIQKNFNYVKKNFEKKN